MLEKVDQWINETNAAYASKRISCERFFKDFEGFYPLPFLQNAYYVVTEDLPKPDFPELHAMGLSDLITMDANGITYKNTYYIRPHAVEILRVHFHELVHVAQWQILGAEAFITRYIHEIQQHTYENAPLEKMAYGLDGHFQKNGYRINVPEYVNKNL